MITGKDILNLGIPQGPLVGLALEAARAYEAVDLIDPDVTDGSILAAINHVAQNAQDFLDGAGLEEVSARHQKGFEKLVALAQAVVRQQEDQMLKASFAPRDVPELFGIWGRELIDEMAILQMEDAMRLPITVAGALMPDAHVGYGVPIGAVVATEGAVIPGAVGVDIACQMRLSVFDMGEGALKGRRDVLRRALLEELHFGQAPSPLKRDHAVLEDPRWREVPILRTIRNTGRAQLGSSGGGNHFGEFGTFETLVPLRHRYGPFDKGTRYLAFLTHSGSRGVGSKVAKHFSRLAAERCYGLPQDLKDLAWLPLDSEAGAEYWAAMELCADYAAACHELMHQHVARAIGAHVIYQAANAHNLAFKETFGGRELIVHRKGATPAGKDVIGIIPGSMADPGYLVRGLGDAAALNSASHGSGRLRSRSESKRVLSPAAWQAYLAERGVELLSAGIDEAPQAYKNIDDVLAVQSNLVEALGRFLPRIVRMDGEAEDEG